MKRYLYKNIVLKPSYRMWDAYYKICTNGKYNTMFLLASGFRTKKDAYIGGKAEVDYLNEKP